MPINVYPAIDLRGGKVVRLRYGDPAQQTVFDDDPEAAARRWAQAGAGWLHVVNLDGAIDGGGPAAEANAALLPRLASLGPRGQFGGGIRTLADIERLIQRGASRVILGSVAVERPELVMEAVDRFGPSAIVIGLDARDGKVRTRGWQDDSGVAAVELGIRMRERGVEYALYTDIGRDGVMAGVNVGSTADLARRTGLRVIASGGVAGLADLRALKARAGDGIEGVVIGRALYEGTIDLSEALKEAEG